MTRSTTRAYKNIQSVVIAIFAFAFLLFFGIAPASAHTVSYGILPGANPGTYTFIYGTYHQGPFIAEGSLDLTCGSSPKLNKPFGNVVYSLPAGLHTGANANYFFASGYTGDP